MSEVEPVGGVKDRKQEKKKKEVQKRSSLSNLDPFVDADGVIRVGGRLENSQLESKVKHPVVIPKDSAASALEAYRSTWRPTGALSAYRKYVGARSAYSKKGRSVEQK